MSNFIEFLKIGVFGLVEGFTEWLPISSTGQLILVENIVHLNASAEFMKVFRVVIQLGAIMAVVVLYVNRLNPGAPGKKKNQQLATWHLWIKILIACLPAAVVGLLLDEVQDNEKDPVDDQHGRHHIGVIPVSYTHLAAVGKGI